MPTPQLDKTLEELKITIHNRLTAQIYAVQLGTKERSEAVGEIEKLINQAYNLGVTTTIERMEGIIDIPQTRWGNAIHQVKADIDHFRHEQRQALSTFKQELLEEQTLTNLKDK